MAGSSGSVFVDCCCNFCFLFRCFVWWFVPLFAVVVGAASVVLGALICGGAFDVAGLSRGYGLVLWVVFLVSYERSNVGGCLAFVVFGVCTFRLGMLIVNVVAPVD